MNRHFFRIATSIFLCWCLSHCASIQSPTGGPKDKTPPALLSSIPSAKQTLFHGTTVLLTFDEDVKLNSPKEQIIIVPSPGKEVEFKVKNNRVFITPKDPWKDSTTYSILFRDGIQDVTESNTPPNLRLAFSTGPHIDSLMITGTVTDMLKGTSKEEITVAIYPEDTFNIFEHTPTYFTKTDKHGNFRLENIQAGKFYVYAFDDDNKNLKVESRSEMFGFIKDPITLVRNIDTLEIGLVQLDSRPLKVSSIRNLGKFMRVKFSKALLDFTITSEKEIVSAFGDNATEVNLWSPAGKDSLLIKFTGRDSLGIAKDTTLYLKNTDTKPPAEKFVVTLHGATINPENGRLNSTISFSKPITKFVYDSIYIKVDTTSTIPITKEDMTYESVKKQLEISKDLGKKMFGPEDNPILNLMMKKSFAISIDGDSAKQVSEKPTIYWPEENGVITVQANTKRKNYILELVEKSSNKVVAYTVNNPKLVGRNIPPTDYLIRVILDDNQNGKWDPGNIYKRIEPEKVIYYKAPDGTSSVPIRANWEVGPLAFTF